MSYVQIQMLQTDIMVLPITVGQLCLTRPIFQTRQENFRDCFMAQVTFSQTSLCKVSIKKKKINKSYSHLLMPHPPISSILFIPHIHYYQHMRKNVVGVVTCHF